MVSETGDEACPRGGQVTLRLPLQQNLGVFPPNRKRETLRVLEGVK